LYRSSTSKKEVLRQEQIPVLWQYGDRVSIG
jgi:hypothetical protein